MSASMSESDCIVYGRAHAPVGAYADVNEASRAMRAAGAGACIVQGGVVRRHHHNSTEAQKREIARRERDGLYAPNSASPEQSPPLVDDAKELVDERVETEPLPRATPSLPPVKCAHPQCKEPRRGDLSKSKTALLCNAHKQAVYTARNMNRVPVWWTAISGEESTRLTVNQCVTPVSTVAAPSAADVPLDPIEQAANLVGERAARTKRAELREIEAKSRARAIAAAWLLIAEMEES